MDNENRRNENFTASSKKDDVIEIDLLELLVEVKKYIFAVILVTVLGGAIGFMVSRFLISPTYTSTAVIHVMSKETTLTSLADLQIGSQLTADYEVLVTSRTVMEDTIRELGIADMDYLQLRDKITIENPTNTRILKISVVDTDPLMAKQLVDTVAETASLYISDILEQNPPKIIEYGQIPIKKTGPKTGTNTAIGAMLALALAVGVITVNYMVNDTIKAEDDLEVKCETPVLAAIPFRDPKAASKGQYKYGYSNEGKVRKKGGHKNE